MPQRHHVGVSFEIYDDFEYEDDRTVHESFLFWYTACGMKFIDNSYENNQAARDSKTPNNIVYVPGVGKVFPEWSCKAQIISTNCDICERYIGLKVLAEAEL